MYLQLRSLSCISRSNLNNGQSRPVGPGWYQMLVNFVGSYNQGHEEYSSTKVIEELKVQTISWSSGDRNLVTKPQLFSQASVRSILGNSCLARAAKYTHEHGLELPSTSALNLHRRVTYQICYSTVNGGASKKTFISERSWNGSEIFDAFSG